MSYDLEAETSRAKFLDWIDNNLQKIKSYLILEHEDILINLYENQELIEND